MSTDALAALLNESARLYQESDDPRSGVEYTADYLRAHGVVVLPPDHPLRTGEPSEAMTEAALIAHTTLVLGAISVAAQFRAEMVNALRAALAVLRV